LNAILGVGNRILPQTAILASRSVEREDFTTLPSEDRIIRSSVFDCRLLTPEASFHRSIPFKSVATPLLHIVTKGLVVEFTRLERHVTPHADIPSLRYAGLDPLKERQWRGNWHLTLMVLECDIPNPPSCISAST